MKFIKGRQLKAEKGFTLMELMVVMLILGLIAAYGLPRYLSSIRTAKLGQVIASYDAVTTEVSAALYAPGSTSSSVETTVITNSNADLTNPFDSSKDAVVGNAATPTAGQIKVDGTTTAGMVTVTAYDDDDPAAAMTYTTDIDDPKD